MRIRKIEIDFSTRLSGTCEPLLLTWAGGEQMKSLKQIRDTDVLRLGLTLLTLSRELSKQQSDPATKDAVRQYVGGAMKKMVKRPDRFPGGLWPRGDVARPLLSAASPSHPLPDGFSHPCDGLVFPG